MHLWEIDKEIFECIDMETGEILDSEKFNKLSMDRNTKLKNMCRWQVQTEAEVEMYKAQKKHFDEMQKQAEKRAENLKNFIASYLNGEKFEADDKSVKVSWRKSEEVDIPEGYDVWKLDEKFLKYEDPKPVKAEIKKFLKEGNTIEGIKLVQKNNISIR